MHSPAAHDARLDAADDLTELAAELATELAPEDCDREEADEELGGVHGDVEHWFVPGPMTAKQVLPRHSVCVAIPDELLLATGVEDAFDELFEELCEADCEEREERLRELLNAEEEDEIADDTDEDVGFRLQLAVHTVVAWISQNDLSGQQLVKPAHAQDAPDAHVGPPSHSSPLAACTLPSPQYVSLQLLLQMSSSTSLPSSHSSPLWPIPSPHLPGELELEDEAGLQSPSFVHSLTPVSPGYGLISHLLAIQIPYLPSELDTREDVTEDCGVELRALLTPGVLLREELAGGKSHGDCVHWSAPGPWTVRHERLKQILWKYCGTLDASEEALEPSERADDAEAVLLLMLEAADDCAALLLAGTDEREEHTIPGGQDETDDAGALLLAPAETLKALLAVGTELFAADDGVGPALEPPVPPVSPPSVPPSPPVSPPLVPPVAPPVVPVVSPPVVPDVPPEMPPEVPPVVPPVAPPDDPPVVSEQASGQLSSHNRASQPEALSLHT